MAERKFAVRFSVEDMAKAKADLQQFGGSGAAAIKAIDQASMKATPSLKALDSAAGEVRSQFSRFADQIPIVGGALKALGPAGTAAAAGIGALAFGAGKLFDAAKKAIDDISAIKDAADNVSMLSEDYQAMLAEGGQAGIKGEAMQQFLSTLAVNSAKASEGFGKMKKALDIVDPTLGAAIAKATTQAERLDLIALALQSTENYTLKLNIATAAFGGQGAQMIRVLDQANGSLETFKTRAKEAGLVIEEGLVDQVEALGDRLDILAKKGEVAGQRVAVAWAPLVEAIEKTKIAGLDQLADLGERFEVFKGIGDKSARALEEERSAWEMRLRSNAAMIAQLRADIERGSGDPGRLQFFIDQSVRMQERLAEVYRQIQRNRDAAASAQAPTGEAPAAANVYTGPDMKDGMTLWEYIRNQQAEKAKAAAAAAEAAAKRQAAANKLVEESQAAAAAEAKKWQDVIDSNRTATEKATDALDELYLAFYLGSVKQDQYNQLLPILTKNLNDAKGAAEAATPAFQAVEEARKRISDAAKANMSESQLVAVEQQRLNALIGTKGKDGVVFSAEEAAKALDAYKDSLHDAKDGMFELRAGAELLNEALDGQIKTIGDVGRVFVKVLKQMLMESLLAQQQLGKGGGLGDFGSWFASIFNFGGGSSPMPASNGSHAAAGVHHDGRQIGDASSFRMISLASYRGARRAHSGFAPDEYPIIAQTGERMLSRTDNGVFTRAIERLAAGGGAPGGVSIRIVDETGARFETSERASADGGRELEIRVRKIARSEALSAMASPDGAVVMKSQYGVGRRIG